MRKWVLIPVCLLILCVTQGFANTGNDRPPGSQTRGNSWADSVLQTLTLQEKIGQLIFVRANKDNSYLPEISDYIQKYAIGGVVFFKGSPLKQATMTNTWQRLSKVPLFISIDAERGLGMRLDSSFSFPYQMTLGACRDDNLVYQVSDEIGRECRRMGIHINFAPVVDINSNPNNPVINVRSFGEDRKRVTRKALLYIKGLKENQVLHTAKHFPGHGDTDADSHYTLPTVLHNRQLLDSIDLYPYHQLIPQGLEGVMTAHIFVPALDSSHKLPASLSNKLINGILKKEMGFSGLVFTDALEMKGVTNYYKPGEIELKALLAGDDILLMPSDVNAAIQTIMLAVDSCVIWPEDIDEKCLKILKYKEKYIPLPWKPVPLSDLVRDINPVNNELLTQEIYQKALTLISDDRHLIPIQHLDTLRIASLCLGSRSSNGFQSYLSRYAPMDSYFLPNNATQGQCDTLQSQLQAYNLILAFFVNTSIYAEKNFGLSAIPLGFVEKLTAAKPLILTMFGNPYSIGKIKNPGAFASILVAYQDHPAAYLAAAQALFGSTPVQGRLPVSINGYYPSGLGMDRPRQDVLRFDMPETLYIGQDELKRADSLILSGIEKKAYPGCQVLVAWKGNVIYYKSFGKPAYEDSLPVRKDDLYDLASLTKVAATTLAIMKLKEEGKIDLDQYLSFYLPELKNTNKKNMVIRDVLTHQARLKSWIPFYSTVVKNRKPDTLVFRRVYDSVYCVPVATGLFMKASYRDSIRDQIIHSPLERKTGYKYSDLGFYLLKELVEKVSGEEFDSYLSRNFYRPLGLRTMCFNPLDRYPMNRIMPTEHDTSFRQQTIRAYVHDPGAAMMGGISGHAGLFSDVLDLAIINQMLLNGGEYGGRRYLNEETIEEFTTVQFPLNNNRRGLGFDKPPLSRVADGPCCESASPQSFGHSGFTGTYFWTDPEQDLIFVFLSNRVYPDASNKKLAEMNIRTRLNELFYGIIRNAGKKDVRIPVDR